jgi:hypothetical protein
MSTDTQPDADADGKAAIEPPENEPETDNRDREAWKVHCRECNELVPAKPYCYECGAARPADGDYYVGTEAESR